MKALQVFLVTPLNFVFEHIVFFLQIILTEDQNILLMKVRPRKKYTSLSIKTKQLKPTGTSSLLERVILYIIF